MSSQEVATTEFSQEIDNSRNKNAVHCQFCNSIMLKAYMGMYLETQFSLPLMHQKSKTIKMECKMECETILHYWQVDDMFTFENIGFSHTVENWKYLICADCEMGPVGYHDLTSKNSYVALKRVKHVKPMGDFKVKKESF